MTSSGLDPSHPIDVTSLGAQLLRPRRPRLAEVRAAMEGVSSGEGAWQHLFAQGLIPHELFRAPDRRFAMVNTERTPLAAGAEDLELGATPLTVEIAVTLASDA